MASKQPTPPPFVKESKDYQNNPFYIATNGFSLVFKYAKSVAIFLLILSVIMAIVQFATPSPTDNNATKTTDEFIQSIEPSQLATIAAAAVLFSLAIVVVSIMISGISGYTAAQASQGKTTTLRQAFNAVLGRFGSYAWLSILIGVKVFLWTLLLIIPGIIMSVRYSLSSAVFFDDRNTLKGNEAIKKSSELVKGSWLTTFAAQSLFNIITLGWISFFISTSTQTALYKQYTEVAAAGTEKPRAHWLSWLTLFLPIILITIAISLLVLLVAALSSYGFSEG